jgi:non-ribosomal peptide synthetase component F
MRRVTEAPRGPFLPRPARHEDDGPPCTRLDGALGRWDALRTRAARRNISVDAVLVAALDVVLAAWTRVRRPFTTIVALAGRDRTAPDAPWAIGDFTALSWVTESLEAVPFAHRAAAVDRTLAADLAHRSSSPIEARHRLDRRTSDDTGEHRVVFTACTSDGPIAWPDGVTWGYGVSSTPGVDLDCYVHNLGGRLSIHWDYRRATVADDAAADMFAAYRHLLERLALDDEAWGASRLLEAGGVEKTPLHTQVEGSE